LETEEGFDSPPRIPRSPCTERRRRWFVVTSTDFVAASRDMDVLPMCSIFQELQIVHDTGYFSALPSLEEYWQQVNQDVGARVVVVVGVGFVVSFF